VKLLIEVNHPNLIQLYEVLESSQVSSIHISINSYRYFSFQNLYLIVELCEGGELGGYVQKNGPLPEETVKQIMTKLINALHYLHKMGTVNYALFFFSIIIVYFVSFFRYCTS
jgi:serine/threonine protein kinase